MKEIIFIAVLFVLSMLLNAMITRWSAKRVLGIEVSWLKSTLIITGRSLCALLAGFVVGFAIRLGLTGELDQNILQIIGMVIVAGLSFLAYWILLGKMTNTRITFWGMTKTVGTEAVMLSVTVLGISVVLSTVFYMFGA